MLGVPANAPDEALKIAQTGRFCTEKVKASPSTSLAVGLNEYADPATTVVPGDPMIEGGWFAGAMTCTAKAGNEVLTWPSLTVITIFE